MTYPNLHDPATRGRLLDMASELLAELPRGQDPREALAVLALAFVGAAHAAGELGRAQDLVRVASRVYYAADGCGQ